MMPRISSAAMLPPNLAGFPWPDMLHMWDLDLPWRATRLRLLHQPSDLLAPATPGLSAIPFLNEAWLKHAEIWLWLEERYRLPRVPKFEADGHGVFFADSSEQSYARVEAWSEFYIGSRK